MESWTWEVRGSPCTKSMVIFSYFHLCIGYKLYNIFLHYFPTIGHFQITIHFYASRTYRKFWHIYISYDLLSQIIINRYCNIFMETKCSIIISAFFHYPSFIHPTQYFTNFRIIWLGYLDILQHCRIGCEVI